MMNFKHLFEAALIASKQLVVIPQDRIDDILCTIASAIIKNSDVILSANALDLAKMSNDDPLYDRLMLTKQRIEAIAQDMCNVAELKSPIGEILSTIVRPNGMSITKVRVPFGVIGVIYEARPNVSCDVFGLCFKTANVSILKGSKDAQNSNEAIVKIIRASLVNEGVDANIITLLPVEKEATAELLNAVGYVDLLIPRGNSSLINYVRDNSRIPVIETGAGICHTYIDSSADISKAKDIIFNAKSRRVSVCNALDCIVVHKDRLIDIAEICLPLSNKEVVIYADEASFAALDGVYNHKLLKSADASSYGTEFLDYKMAIKTVNNISEAIEHISKYSSKHSECIVAKENESIFYFTKRVDAACVYVNVSTAFTDGAQFGFGAEIGISTQKLHARGPMALPELTSYKYIIKGNGQTRE